MSRHFWLIFLPLILILQGCRNLPDNVIITDEYPLIYPDYVNVTIPVNIAPLNFRMKDKSRMLNVVFSGKNNSISVSSDYKVKIPEKKWRSLLEDCAGDSVSVSVSALIGKKWYGYKPFSFYVSKDKIDPYLSYRLIEPGYEVWNNISVCQRNITNFEETTLVDNKLIDGGCVNCHTYAMQNARLSFFHIRHKNGGTIIQDHGKLRKIDTRADSVISAGVYGNWHPGGRFIAFSTNVIIPGFHSVNNLRLEVYDTLSDVIILDIEKDEIISPPVISDKNAFETFPVFSADGSKLYFCSAKAVAMPENYRKVRYSLCSIDFDPLTRTLGSTVDTLVSGFRTGKTVSQPKTSPDGRYILYTSFDYGNFPLWHREADLHLMDLATRSIDTLAPVNSDMADSYHSWSSNSRWFVFASKQDDGMYGKPYFAHIDENGRAAKPFLLPQEDAGFYDSFLKSYNIPELAKDKVFFNSYDIEKAFRNLKAERTKLISK